jgi:outer membrane protein TolC
MKVTMNTVSRIAALSLSLTLASCTSFSPDGGFSSVQGVAEKRLDKKLVWAKTPEQQKLVKDEVQRLLSKPLSIDNAVQLALLNNRGLQAQYAELGLSEADLVSAGRLPNPHFSMLRAHKTDSGMRDYKIEQAFVMNVFAFITMPQAIAIERRRFEQTQALVAMQMLSLAADTRKAYVQAIASQQTLAYMQQVQEAAQASAELAKRMFEVGNFNQLQLAREQNFYADAAVNVARTDLIARNYREGLTRVLGLWGDQTQFKLPERLPDLPQTARDIPDVEQMAIAQRLDLQALRIETDALAKNLGLTKTTRFINVLEFGPARVLEGHKGDPYKKGYEISFELPIFDWGTSKVARARTLYEQQLNRAAQMAVEARSEVRQAYSTYRIQFDIAKHFRDEIVPLRMRISDENLLRYNGMFIGVFELLADKRSQISAVNGYIDALRDFWLAQADLEMSLLGKPVLSTTSGPRASVQQEAGH